MPPSPHPDAVESDLSQSALQLTRAAIARWRGDQTTVHALPRDRPHVSPQATHLATARRNLAAWRAQGGFAQEAGASALAPHLARDNACID